MFHFTIEIVDRIGIFPNDIDKTARCKLPGINSINIKIIIVLIGFRNWKQAKEPSFCNKKKSVAEL
jgi:hypothetical protein